MSETDSLDFIRDIRITQFWREKLGEEAYHNYEPKDLRRWYEAMDLRGAEDLRAYVLERESRFPRREVTGLVTVPPHPPLALVEMWLEAMEPRSYTAQVLMGVAAFGISSFFIVTNLHSCQLVQPPDQLAQFQPQAAVLSMGNNNGVPPATATLPTSLAGVPSPYVAPTGVSVSGYEPMAGSIRAQQGTANATAGIGIPGMSPFSGQSTSGSPPGMPASPAGSTGTMPGGGIASPGPSAYGSSSGFAAPTMHSANSGSSSNLPGLSGSTP